MSEILFTSFVLAFALGIFALIARAMIVDSRERARYLTLDRARRLRMDPGRRAELRSTLVRMFAGSVNGNACSNGRMGLHGAS